MINIRKQLVIPATLLLSAATLATACSPSQSDGGEYPNRSIRIVVPYEPGGSTSATAQVIGQALEDRWDVTVTVENKPGGNSVIAGQELAGAKADGYTVMLDAAPSSSLLFTVVPDPPFDPMDRTFLGSTAGTPLFFSVPADSEFETLADVAEAVKANPASFSWSSMGAGAAGGINQVFYLFFKELGIDPADTNPISAEGSSEAATLVASGRVEMAASSLGAIKPLVDAGKAKIIAVTAADGSPLLPDVPSTADAGFPSVEVVTWLGFSGPPDMPDDVVAAWEKALSELVEDRGVSSKLESAGIQPQFLDSGALRTLMTEEREAVAEAFDLQIPNS